jgi:hypothetical protein
MRLTKKLATLATGDGSPPLTARSSRPDVVDSDVVCLRKIVFALTTWNSKLKSLHHFAVIAPTNVLLVVVTHLTNVRSVSG